MTSCIACPDREEHDRDYESGWSCCRRAHDRMLAALRDIPVLVDELSGLGYVERDTREGTRAVREGKLIVRVPATADPVANLWPAGPTNGQSSQPRVGGSALPSVPIRIDPTDLLAPARPASLAVADVGLYASDQVGHLAVATELEFWARDWADQLGERSPYPTVGVLSGWLLDRLDWACKHHLALDEFAAKVTHLRNVLTAATGRLDLRPTPVDRPCPACGVLALQRPPDSPYIECSACARVLTDDDYTSHLKEVIRMATATRVFIAMIHDRHADPEPFPFSTRDAAIAHARQAAIEQSRDGQITEEDVPEGWLYSATYGTEDDAVWVIEKRLDVPIEPGPAKGDAS